MNLIVSPIQLLNEYAQSVKGNGEGANFAESLAYVINKTGQIPLANEILGIIGTVSSEKNESRTKNSSNTSPKLKSLYVKGIRKFEDNNRFYRLDFTDKDANPVSCVYVGRNGVGKTSLYNAMEMVLLGKVKSIDHVDMDIAEQMSYMHNVFAKDPESGMAVIDTDGNGKESQLVYRIKGKCNRFYFPPACFCSGLDVEMLVQNGIPKDYIADQLGLSEVKTLVENLSRAYGIFQDVKAQSTGLFETLTTYDLKLKGNLPSEELNLESKYNNCKEEIFILRKKFPVLERSDEEISDFIKCKDFVDDYYKRTLHRLASRAKVIIDYLVSEFMGDDIEKTEIQHIEPYSLSLKITPRNTSSKGIPSKRQVSAVYYLNHFRQKLFYVAFKAALFMFAREEYGIDYPFIVDDIFDSSDFENRDKARDFMFRLHSRDVSKEPGSSLLGPVQVILFTHDDVIAEESYKGMVMSGVDAKFSRIFDYKLIGPEDYKRSYKVLTVKDDNSTFQTVKIEDEL